MFHVSSSHSLIPVHDMFLGLNKRLFQFILKWISNEINFVSHFTRTLLNIEHFT